MTSDPERALATVLRWAGLPEPVTEFRFDSTRRWRFDFAWPDRRLAVEVEGGRWVAGRHTHGDGFARDAEKYNEAALAGWRVIRVVPDDIDSGRALAWITRGLG